MMDHKIKEQQKNRLGTTRKSIQLDFLGIITSFLTNFKPSSIGCNLVRTNMPFSSPSIENRVRLPHSATSRLLYFTVKGGQSYTLGLVWCCSCTQLCCTPRWYRSYRYRYWWSESWLIRKHVCCSIEVQGLSMVDSL